MLGFGLILVQHMHTNKITVKLQDCTLMLYHSTQKLNIYGVIFKLALCAYVNLLLISYYFYNYLNHKCLLFLSSPQNGLILSVRQDNTILLYSLMNLRSLNSINYLNLKLIVIILDYLIYLLRLLIFVLLFCFLQIMKQPRNI